MSNCKYTLKVNNEELMFDNELLLNDYINKNIKSYITENGDIAYSLDGSEAVQNYLNLPISSSQKEVLEKLLPNTKSRFDSDAKQHIIGVSRYIKNNNISGNNSEYDYVEQVKNLRTKGTPDAEIVTKILKQIQAANVGTLVHKIYENVGKTIVDIANNNSKNVSIVDLKNSKDVLVQQTKDYLDSLNSQIEKYGFTKLDTKSKDPLIIEINEKAKKSINIELKHIEDMVESASQDLYSNLESMGHIVNDKLKSIILLEQELYLKDSFDSNKDIKGILDMLIIDTNGKLSIVDYKTSSKEYFNWHKNKKKDVYAQQRMYQEMLIKQDIHSYDIQMLIKPIVYDSELVDGQITSIVNKILKDEKQKIINLATESIEDKLIISSKVSTHLSNEFKNIERTDLQIKADNLIDKYFPKYRDFENKIRQNAINYLQVMGKENEDGTWTIETKEWNKQTKSKETVEHTVPFEKAIELVQKNITANKLTYKGAITTKIKETLVQIAQHKLPLEAIVKYVEKEKISGSFYKNILERYFMSGRYQIMDSPDLENQGILLFRDIFTESSFGTPIIEAVVLSESNLNALVKCKQENNLLGNARNKFFFRKDTGTHLPSTMGNIEALVAVHLMAQKPELFGQESNFTLGNIMMANVTDSTYNRVPINPLVSDYKTLKKDINGDIFDDIVKDINIQKPNLKTRLYSLLDFLLQNRPYNEELSEYESDSLTDKITEINNNRNNKENKEVISDLIKQIKNTIKELKIPDNLNSKGQMSNILRDLELMLIEDVYSIEDQVRDDVSGVLGFVNKGFTSSWIDSPSNIHNKYIGEIHRTIQTTSSQIRQKYTPIMTQINKTTKKLFENMGYSKTQKTVSGNDTKQFEKIIRLDDAGNLNQSFKIKFLDDITDPNEKALAKYYLEQFYILKQKYRNKHFQMNEQFKAEFELELKIKESSIYDIPLMRKNNEKMSVIKDNFKEAIRKGFNKETYSFDKAKQKFNSFFDEDSEEYAISGAKNRLIPNKETVYNAMKQYTLNPVERQAYLVKRGVDFFETNLNTVLLQANFDYIKETEFMSVLPKINSIKDVIIFDSFASNISVEGLEEYINNMISNSVLKQDTYKSPAYKLANKTISIMKSISSRIIFMGNPQNLFRDLGDGMWRGFIENQLKFGYKQLKKESFLEAAKIIMKSPSNSDVEKLSALNSMMGMTNMDIDQIVERTKLERSGMQAFWSRWSMSTVTGGDYINRMTLLTAYMIEDGVWDSMEYDSELGILTYNIRKDKRFDALFKENPDTESLEYKNQKNLLLEIISQHNKEDTTEKQGLTLTGVLSGIQTIKSPYTIKEINSMKHISDTMYGFFDKTERMRISNSLLGMLYLHFGTYISAGVARYFAPGGVNQFQGKYVEAVDEEGNKLYRHINPNTEEITINTDPEGGELMYKWEGDYMEGIFASLINTVQDISEALYNGDWKTFKENFNSDENKAVRQNLSRLIRDLIMWSFFAWVGRSYNENIAPNENIPGVLKVPAYMITFGAVNSARDLLFPMDVFNRLGIGTSPSMGIPSIPIIFNAVTSPKYLFSVDPNLPKFVNQWSNVSKTILNPERKLYGVE